MSILKGQGFNHIFCVKVKLINLEVKGYASVNSILSSDNLSDFTFTASL